MRTKRPANDGAPHDPAAALYDELIEAAAHATAVDEAQHPDAAAHRLATEGRALVGRLHTPLAAGSISDPPRGEPISLAAIDLAAMRRVAAEEDAARAAYAEVRALDTARIARLSRAELVRLIAAHPSRTLDADLLEELSDADLRDEVRALRGAATSPR